MIFSVNYELSPLVKFWKKSLRGDLWFLMQQIIKNIFENISTEFFFQRRSFIYENYTLSIGFYVKISFLKNKFYKYLGTASSFTKDLWNINFFLWFDSSFGKYYFDYLYSGYLTFHWNIMFWEMTPYTPSFHRTVPPRGTH